MKQQGQKTYVCGNIKPLNNRRILTCSYFASCKGQCIWYFRSFTRVFQTQFRTSWIILRNIGRNEIMSEIFQLRTKSRVNLKKLWSKRTKEVLPRDYAETNMRSSAGRRHFWRLSTQQKVHILVMYATITATKYS
jgi:hypothetical protein